MKKLILLLLFPILTYGQVQIGEDIDGETAGDQSGVRVKLSSNGNIVAVGAINNNGNGSNSGHVKVYENQNGNWIQVGQDIDGENEFDTAGRDISLSSDGNIIAIGSVLSNNALGKVQVFENQNDTWIQIGENLLGNIPNGQFGTSISLSSNGNIIAIGAPVSNNNNNNNGVVYVYENQNGNWVQIGQDIDGEAIGDNAGFSLDLSSDGNILAIGALRNDNNGVDSGNVRVFENQNGNWTQIGQNINGENDGDVLGTSVKLSSNGTILATGLFGANDNNGVQTGQVKVFENQNGNWTQIGQNINGEAENDFFGVRLSLSSEGNILAIGAIFNADAGTNAGHVRIYENQNGNWVQIGQDIDGEAEGDTSGRSVSLSSNGSVVAIGADFNDGNGLDSGHTRVFDLSDLLSTKEFTSATFSLYPNPASTQVIIEIPQENTLEKVTIYNSLGQQILSSKETKISTSTLSQGIYVIEVTTNQGIASKKLIIE